MPSLRDLAWQTPDKQAVTFLFPHKFATKEAISLIGTFLERPHSFLDQSHFSHCDILGPHTVWPLQNSDIFPYVLLVLYV